MLELSEQIHSYLRACANCGRGTLIKAANYNLYCERCWQKLLSISDGRPCYDYPFQARSLFVWSHFNPQVENLIYSLKGGGLPSAYRELAETFVLRAKIERRNRLLVVPPSSRDTPEDHAWCWGEALSSVLSCQMTAPFEFATEKAIEKGFIKSIIKTALKPQKQKGLKERFERQFELKERLNLRGRSIVFVDDLITSGATAMAAYNALKSPVNFEVWTIARRPKLAAL